MRIHHGCQGRQRRLYSLDSHDEYAYTLAAIDKLESKEWHFTHKPVKVPKIPPLLCIIQGKNGIDSPPLSANHRKGHFLTN